MSTAVFDTYAQVTQLVQTGVPEVQAEAIINAVDGATALPDITQLATEANLAIDKSDVALVENNRRDEIKALEGKLEGQIKGLRGELIWWILGAVGVTAVFPQILAHLPR